MTGSAMDDRLLEQLLKHRAELFGYIRAIVRNTHDAEDLFQEVSMATVRHAAGQAHIRDFRAWSKEVARRLVMKHFRSKKTRASASLPGDEMADLIDSVYASHNPAHRELTAQYDALDRCLRSLSPDSADFLKKRYAEDMPYARIARAVRKSEQAVRRAVARARRALVDCVRRKLGLESVGERS